MASSINTDTWNQIDEIESDDSYLFPLTYRLFAKFMERAEAQFKEDQRKFEVLAAAWQELQKQRVKDEFDYEVFVKNYENRESN